MLPVIIARVCDSNATCDHRPDKGGAGNKEVIVTHALDLVNNEDTATANFGIVQVIEHKAKAVPALKDLTCSAEGVSIDGWWQ